MSLNQSVSQSVSLFHSRNRKEIFSFNFYKNKNFIYLFKHHKCYLRSYKWRGRRRGEEKIKYTQWKIRKKLTVKLTVPSLTPSLYSKKKKKNFSAKVWPRKIANEYSNFSFWLFFFRLFITGILSFNEFPLNLLFFLSPSPPPFRSKDMESSKADLKFGWIFLIEFFLALSFKQKQKKI